MLTIVLSTCPQMALAMILELAIAQMEIQPTHVRVLLGSLATTAQKTLMNVTPPLVKMVQFV
jgi:hypothetical protein